LATPHVHYLKSLTRTHFKIKKTYGEGGAANALHDTLEKINTSIVNKLVEINTSIVNKLVASGEEP
jgi:hypothetical protein